MSLYLLPAVGAALSAFTLKHVWVDHTNLPAVLTSCKRVVAYTAFSRNTAEALVKDLLCIRTTHLQKLFADRSGVGALLVYGSLLMPLFIKLSYHAGSPNNSSFLQGPLLPLLALLLTTVDVLFVGSGFAIFIPLLLSVLYIAGSSKSKKSFGLPRVPCPAQAIYGANIAAVLLSAFLISTMLYDEESAKAQYWWEQFAPPQIASVFKPLREAAGNLIPVVAVPILLLGYGEVKRIASEEEAKVEMKEFLAEEIAYGFERTWAYYRQTGLLSFMSYALGLSRIYRGVITDGAVPSLQAQYILLVSASLAVTLLTTVLTDAQTAPEDDDKEALKAIARAPAGNPGVENNAKVLIPLAIVAGPSLSAMLWFAHIEEIRGYKGRRAWRAYSAANETSK